jgi:uncharacterized damage-inducible protein DinB
MELADLRTLLDYHYWARDRVLEAAEALSPEQFTCDVKSSFPSVRDTLAHTYSAEWAWYSRWRGTSPTAHLPFDQFASVADLRNAWKALETNVRSYLDALGEADVHRVIEYRLLSGEPGATPFSQMLQHMVNHASYHRGQVTTMLRQQGARPPKSMDLIAFYRLRAAGR